MPRSVTKQVEASFIDELILWLGLNPSHGCMLVNDKKSTVSDTDIYLHVGGSLDR